MRAFVLMALLVGCGGNGVDCYVEVPGETTADNACAACPGEKVGDSCVASGETAACVERDRCDYVADDCWYLRDRQTGCAACADVFGADPPKCQPPRGFGGPQRCFVNERACLRFYAP